MAEAAEKVDTMAEDVATACLLMVLAAADAEGVNIARHLARLSDEVASKVALAFARGPRCLVLVRLDPEGPRLIASEDDARLRRFVDEAHKAGHRRVGFNPHKIAAAIRAMGQELAA